MRVTSESKLKFPLEIPPEPPKLTEDEIVAFAVDLVRSENLAGVAYAVVAGNKILDRFYGGSWPCFQRYNRDDKSVLQLVEAIRSCGYTSWGKNRVYRTVYLYQQSREFEEYQTWSNLGVTHYYVVQGLSWEQQKKLLIDAQKYAWTTDQLAEQAQALRPKRNKRSGEALTDVRQALERVLKALDVHEEWLADLNEAGVDPARVKGFDEALDLFTQRSQDVMSDLAARGRKPRRRSAKAPKPQPQPT